MSQAVVSQHPWCVGEPQHNVLHALIGKLCTAMLQNFSIILVATCLIQSSALWLYPRDDLHELDVLVHMQMELSGLSCQELQEHGLEIMRFMLRSCIYQRELDITKVVGYHTAQVAASRLG